MIAVEASAVVAGVDGRIRGHKGMVYALVVIGDVVVGAAASTGAAEVVAENEEFDERRKESRRRSNLSDSSRHGEADSWTEGTQKKQVCSRRELEVPEQKRGRRKQESGRRNSDL